MLAAATFVSASTIRAPPFERLSRPVQTIRPRLVATEDFFIVEPQANVSVRGPDGIGISCGAGYRQTANVDLLRDRLNGPSASLAIQFGF
jgi:hypothetical protein